jgi:hypothetical protein
MPGGQELLACELCLPKIDQMTDASDTGGSLDVRVRQVISDLVNEFLFKFVQAGCQGVIWRLAFSLSGKVLFS